jgi:hypothetical protein
MSSAAGELTVVVVMDSTLHCNIPLLRRVEEESSPYKVIRGNLRRYTAL